jgi:hypothetical protein
MSKKTVERLALEMGAAYDRFVLEPTLRNKIRETAAFLRYIMLIYPDKNTLFFSGQLSGLRQAEMLLKDMRGFNAIRK